MQFSFFYRNWCENETFCQITRNNANVRKFAPIYFISKALKMHCIHISKAIDALLLIS